MLNANFMKITKAVITAAGRGTRFLPVVLDYAKEMVPILNKPQIQHLIEEAIGAGITDICIVHRYGEESIKKYFTPSPDWEEYLNKIGKIEYLDSLKNINNKLNSLTFIAQPLDLPYGTGSPVLTAKSFIGNDPFVLMYGDDLIVEKNPGQYLTKMIESFEKYLPAVVVCVKDVGREEIARYGSAKFISDDKYPNRISAMLEKLEADKAPSTFAQGGRFVIDGSKIWPILTKQGLSRDNELWFADTVNTLAKDDVVLTEAVGNQADWMTTGDPLRWLMANNIIALNDPKYSEEFKKYLDNLRK